MSRRDTIRTAFRRAVTALERRESLGRGTATTTARLEEGLRCQVSDGDWSFTVDMAPKAGGTNAGPNPGIVGRGALASCLSISYALWAAHRGVPITRLEVTVEADYDSRGMYGVGEVKPEYEAIRFRVAVESPVPEAEIVALLDEAETHCTYLQIFRRPQRVERILTTGRSAAA